MILDSQPQQRRKKCPTSQSLRPRTNGNNGNRSGTDSWLIWPRAITILASIVTWPGWGPSPGCFLWPFLAGSFWMWFVVLLDSINMRVSLRWSFFSQASYSCLFLVFFQFCCGGNLPDGSGESPKGRFLLLNKAPPASILARGLYLYDFYVFPHSSFLILEFHIWHQSLFCIVSSGARPSFLCSSFKFFRSQLFKPKANS